MIAVVVRQGAETDVADAQQRYTREDHHLGIAFVEEFARKVERIRALPDLGDPLGRAGRWLVGGDFTHATSLRATRTCS